MDYQYIYTVVNGNYVVLPSIRPVPPDIEKELARYASNYVGQEPVGEEDFSFFSLEGAKGLPVIGFGKSQKKRNCASVAQMTQCAAWDWDATLLREHFDDLLRFAFYSEAQVDALAEDKGGVPPFGQGEAPIVKDFFDVPIPREVIRAILYSVFARWLSGKAPIRIAVPDRETPRYAQYVLSAVRKIYSYFPVVLRGEAGFISRLQPGKDRSFSRISIIFVPEAQADAKALFLDGSKPAAIESLPNTTNRKSLDRFIDYLSALDDPAKRKAFLDLVFNESELKAELRETASGSARQYETFGETLLLLDNRGTPTEKIDAWLRFCKNEESYPKSAVAKIHATIDAELKPEDLVAFVKQKFPGMDQPDACVAGVTGVLPLCRADKACCTAFVAYLASAAGKSGQSSEAIFHALDKERERWKDCAGQEAYEQFLGEQGVSAAETICRAAQESIEKTRFESLEQYQKDTDQILSQVQSRIDRMLPPEQKKEAVSFLRQRRGEVAGRNLETALGTLRAMPTGTSKEIKKVGAELDKLAAAIDNSAMREELSSIRNQVSAEQDLLRQKGAAASILTRELVGKLNQETNYFAALELLAAEEKNYSAEVLQEGRKSLEGKKPADREAYLKAYKKKYGRDLQQSELLAMKPAMQMYLLEDLRQQSSGTIHLDCANQGPDALLARVNSICALYPGQEPSFIVGDTDFSAAELRTALSLAPLRSGNQIDGKNLRKLCRSLAIEGVFDSRHIPALGELLVSAGQERKYVLIWTLAGKLRNPSKTQCRALVEAIREDIRGQGDEGLVKCLEDCMARASKNNTALDETAEAVCNQYLKELRKNEETSHSLPLWAIILLSAAGLLVIAAVLLYAFGLLKLPGKEEPAVPEIVTVKLTVQNGVLEHSDDTGRENLDKLVSTCINEANRPLMNLPDSVQSDEELLQALGYPTTIILSGDGLTDVNFLSIATGLRKLDLSGNSALAELPQFTEMPYLRFVDVRGTAITAEAAASFCEAHPDCVVLCEDAICRGKSVYTRGDSTWDLKDSGLESLAFLQEPGCVELLDGLRLLDLNGNRMSSLEGLEQLKSLEGLILGGGTKLDSAFCNSIGQLTELKKLVLYDCAMSHETESRLNELKSSNSFDLSPVVITYTSQAEQVSIGGTEYVLGVERLDLSGKKLTNENLAELTRFANLRELDLSDNEISDLSALAGLNSLRRVNVSGNQITDLSPLSQLPALLALYADNNPIESLQFEPGAFNSLQILSLGGDKLANCEGLSALSNLRILLLNNSGTKVGLDEALLSLQNLRVLRLDGTPTLQADTIAQLQTNSVLLLDVAVVEPPPEEEKKEDAADDKADGAEPNEDQGAPGDGTEQTQLDHLEN